MLFFFFDDLHLQIIESISPKASVGNSSAQWAIVFKLDQSTTEKSIFMCIVYKFTNNVLGDLMNHWQARPRYDNVLITNCILQV